MKVSAIVWKLLYISFFSLLVLGGPLSNVLGISLLGIRAALENKLELETDKEKIEVKPVKKASFTYSPIISFSVTLPESEVPMVSATDLMRINLIAKEGTFYQLKKPTKMSKLQAFFTGIDDPLGFFIWEIDLSQIIRCNMVNDFLNCTIRKEDIMPVLFNNPQEKFGCLMFVNKNKDEIDAMINQVRRSMKVTVEEATRRVHNYIAEKGGVRAFCIEKKLTE